jgi:hypothetical protein
MKSPLIGLTPQMAVFGLLQGKLLVWVLLLPILFSFGFLLVYKTSVTFEL